MPEGDTVHKVAAYLAERLEGRALTGFRVRDDPGLDLAGRRVERVHAVGKHLFVTLDGGLLVRSHLGMHGSWHRYAPGEAWKRPERHASLVLETDGDVLVCFSAKEVECLRADGLRARDLERALGPDLIAAPDPEESLRRARAVLEPSAPVADLLLDQRVSAGIGNVYKSELCFLSGLDPVTPWGNLDERTLLALFREATRLLRANLGPGARTTRPDADGAGPLWVYGRAGHPCRRCDGPIAHARLGRGNRDTYWCPACQPYPEPAC